MADDQWKSHLDRINPSDGISPAAAPGARPGYWAAEAALRGETVAIEVIEEAVPVDVMPDPVVIEAAPEIPDVPTTDEDIA